MSSWFLFGDLWSLFYRLHLNLFSDEKWFFYGNRVFFCIVEGTDFMNDHRKPEIRLTSFSPTNCWTPSIGMHDTNTVQVWHHITIHIFVGDSSFW